MIEEVEEEHRVGLLESSPQPAPLLINLVGPVVVAHDHIDLIRARRGKASPVKGKDNCELRSRARPRA